MNVDLRTRYLGLALSTRSSRRPARSPATSRALVRLEEAGVAAVVLPSLFEEQIEHDELGAHADYWTATELSPEAPAATSRSSTTTTSDPTQYLQLIADAQKRRSRSR